MLEQTSLFSVKYKYRYSMRLSDVISMVVCAVAENEVLVQTEPPRTSIAPTIIRIFILQTNMPVDNPWGK